MSEYTDMMDWFDRELGKANAAKDDVLLRQNKLRSNDGDPNTLTAELRTATSKVSEIERKRNNYSMTFTGKRVDDE